MTSRPRATDLVASVNVRITLALDVAVHCLAKIIGGLDGTYERVDLAGLQEWGGRARNRALRRFGRLVRYTGRLRTRPAWKGGPGYTFARSLLGGVPIALRNARFELLAIHAPRLTGPDRVEPDPGNPRRFLGISRATVVLAYDHVLGEEAVVIGYHFTAGIQNRDGSYKRRTHPRRVARHEREVAGVQAIITRQLRHGRTVYAIGDSNFDGLRFRGVTSAWEGNEDHKGTLGSRKPDDVHGPGRATVITIADASDHDALVASRTRP